MNFTAGSICIAAPAPGEGELARLERLEAEAGIDVFLDDRFGFSAATSSISMPPAVDAMKTVRAAARSSTMPRYSSLAIGSVSSISSRCTILALRAGLVRHQLHAEHLVGESRRLLRRLWPA